MNIAVLFSFFNKFNCYKTEINYRYGKNFHLLNYFHALFSENSFLSPNPSIIYENDFFLKFLLPLFIILLNLSKLFGSFCKDFSLKYISHLYNIVRTTFTFYTVVIKLIKLSEILIEIFYKYDNF